MANTTKITLKEFSIYPVGLAYQREFHLSRGNAGTPNQKAPHIFVKLTDSEGYEGWGEARPSRYWSYETPETVINALNTYLAPAVMGIDAEDKTEFDRILSREIAPGLFMGQPIAKSAIEMAWHDLKAKREGVPLAQLFGGKRRNSLPLIYTISAIGPEDVTVQITTAIAQGYRGFKVKLGFGVEADIEMLQAARKVTPAGYLWADANQAYGLEDALILAKRLEALKIDILEQPLVADDYEGLKELKANIEIPLALDESVFSPNLLKHLISLKVLDAVVLKVSKLGGLARTYECMQIAQQHGIQILASGLTESALGFAAGCHLFSTLENPVPVDFNGPQFLAEDPGKLQEVFHDATGFIPNSPGIGIIPDEDYLKAHEWNK